MHNHGTIRTEETNIFDIRYTHLRIEYKKGSASSLRLQNSASYKISFSGLIFRSRLQL